MLKHLIKDFISYSNMVYTAVTKNHTKIKLSLLTNAFGVYLPTLLKEVHIPFKNKLYA